MVTIEPTIKDGQRFKQAEVVEILGINRSTLYRYEKLGLAPAGRPISKYRYYTGAEVKRFWRNYWKQ